MAQYPPYHPVSQLRLAAGIASIVAWIFQIPWIFAMGMMAYGIAGGDNPHTTAGDIEGFILFLNLPSFVAIALGLAAIRGSGKRFYKQMGGLGIILSCAWFIFVIGFVIFMQL
jgi:hypothetical protein